MQLALGTVQFGLNYGVTNTKGQLSSYEVESILCYAYKYSVGILDTALLYGNAERLIGDYCDKFQHSFRVITKTDKFQDIPTHMLATKLKIDLYRSLNYLKLNKIYGLMFHDVDDLINDSNRGRKLFDSIQALKHSGLVDKIGVSVYTPMQLEEILLNYNIDIVQLPLNVFDQRFVYLIPKLKELKIEIYVRSIFLQGLLLNWNRLPEKISTYKWVFNNYQNFLKYNSYSPLDYAINFIKRYSIDYIVVGVSNLSEFISINMAFNKKQNMEMFSLDSPTDINLLIDPRLWNKT